MNSFCLPAQSKVDSLKNILAQTSDEKTRIDLLLTIAESYANSNLDSLLFYLELSLPQIESTNYQIVEAKALFVRGTYFYRSGDYSQAQLNYHQSLKIAKGINAFQIIAKNYNTMGIVLDDLGKYQEAIDYYKRALYIDHLSLNFSGVSNNWNNIGVAHKNLGNYSLAIDYFQKSLRSAELSNDKSAIARSYNNIAIIYELQERYNKALSFYGNALTINKEIGSLYGLANNYYNMGDLEGKQKNYEKALANYFQAFKIDSELGDKAGIASDYSAIANILIQQKKINQASHYLEKALIIQEGNHEENKLPYTLLQLAEIHFDLGNSTLAIEHAERAYQIARRTNKLEYLQQTSELLSEIYFSQGSFQKAYEYQVIFKQTSDSSFSTQKIEEIIHLEDEYNFSKERDSLEIQKRVEIRAVNAEKKELRTQITAIVTGAILILIFSVLITRSYLLNRKNNQKLKILNEEMKAQNEEISQQRDIIADWNITSEKQNFELEQKNQKLAELNEEKNLLIGIVAHDLKSPLNQVKGLLDLSKMSADNTPPEITEYLGLMSDSVERLRTMISRILDVNAIDNQDLNLNMQTLNFLEILNQTAQNFDVLAQKKDIHIHQASSHLKPIIYADIDYLRQVFENIISNAVKFSPKNKNIYLSIEAKGIYLLAKIKDEGPGISESDKKKLFAKFQQLSAKPTNGEDSTGLGLAIVKKYVEAMDGRIWCESELNKGATFIIEFPKYQET